MKYIILVTILTFFSLTNKALAKYQYEIALNDTSYAKMRLQANTEIKAKNKLEKLVLAKEYLKCEWSDKEKDSIFKRKLPKIDDNIRYEYCKPKNFTVIGKDITQEENDREAERQARKEERKKLRKMKQAIDNWDKKEIKKLLKYIIKEIIKE